MIARTTTTNSATATTRLSAMEAKAAGYRPLTNPYKLPQEQPMLDRVLADMRRAHIDHVLVKMETGLAVWRSRTRIVNAAVLRPVNRRGA